MLATNSAFFTRLQGDALNITEIIDLELPNGYGFHWTSANQRLWYTLSGDLTEYIPFPGTGTGADEDMSLGVSVVNFVLANSGSVLQNALLATDFSLASLKLGYIFTDTPDLGRMDFYIGKMGDFTYNRLEITGQARNIWKSLNVQWPYYAYNNKCAWRFGSAGCGFNTASITLNINTISVNSSTSQIILLNSGTLSNSYLPGRFNFGRATITGGTNSGEVRAIQAQTGDMLQLIPPLPNGNLAGLTLAIFPGCQKRLLEDCHSLYNNDKNYMGWPWIPTYETAF